MLIKSPMLAAKIKPSDLAKVVFPVVVQPKLDGYRGLLIQGKFYTRKFLRWPNEHIRNTMEAAAKAVGFDGVLDGEIFIDGNFNTAGGKMRKHEGEPVFRFVVFDCFGWMSATAEHIYADRFTAASSLVKMMRAKGFTQVELIAWDTCVNLKGLEVYEERTLKAGHEGVIMRSPEGPYKQGRATIREGWLTALKRWVDDEARVVGVFEQTENQNEAKRDATGKLKRSSAKAGKVPKGIFGGVVLRWKRGPDFRLSTFQGMTLEDRAWLWSNQNLIMGRLWTFRHKGVGEDKRPREAVGLFVREEWDR